ncbi:MAG: hypothetical protein M0D55_00055 [Elusimicrobiota bacterium]|nr:MAG: hypothetical protein M0D55_00055 [Elusimicrobiota bacterium]
MIAEHVLSVSIAPSGKEEELKLAAALTLLRKEDALLGVGTDPETGKMILYGVGELHLQLVRERLQREFGVKSAFGPLRIVYRETIHREVREEAKFIRKSGGRGQFAHCTLKLEPLADQDGFEFDCDAQGIPPAFVGSVERGVREALDQGPIGGYPLIGIKATLVGASFNEEESNEMAFKIAGAMALRSGCKKASPAILEPVMKLEAAFPEKYAGAVVGELNGRRANILEIGGGSIQKLKGTVPLSEMFGFANTMRGLSSGNVSFMMEPSHFEEIPTEKWRATNDPHSPDEPPTASAGRPVKPSGPKPGIPGGKGKDFPPEQDA